MLQRLCFLAVFVLLSACSKGTYLEVEFTGSLTNIRKIELTLTYTPAGQAAHTGGQDIMFPSGNVVLPASLVLELHRLPNETPVSLMGRAFDAQGALLATAVASTTVKHDQVWKVQMQLGPESDGGVKDALTTGDAQGFDAQMADGCTILEAKASESVTAVEQAGTSGGAPGADVLWAGSKDSGLYGAWIKFPTKAMVVPPSGTKLSSVQLIMHTTEVKGTAFNVQIYFSPANGWNATNPPGPVMMANIMTISDAFSSQPAANAEVAYTLMPVKAWLELLSAGPVTFVIRNAVGATPSTSGSLIAYQGATSSSGSGSGAPLLRFRFCPN